MAIGINLGDEYLEDYTDPDDWTRFLLLEKIVKKYYEGYNAKETGTQEELIKLSDELKDLIDQAKELLP
jgi:hypothetical protein